MKYLKEMAKLKSSKSWYPRRSALTEACTNGMHSANFARNRSDRPRDGKERLNDWIRIDKRMLFGRISPPAR